MWLTRYAGYLITRLAFDARHSATRQLIFEYWITVTRSDEQVSIFGPCYCSRWRGAAPCVSAITVIPRSAQATMIGLAKKSANPTVRTVS
jgi:hypothetical protein